MVQSPITDGDSQPACLEHRWGLRIPCRAMVRLSTGTGMSGTGHVRDVSSSGAFIETTLDLRECTPITVFVRGNESAVRAVEIAAVVVRRQPDGVAVEWSDTPAGSICTALGCVVSCAAMTKCERCASFEGEMP